MVLDGLYASAACRLVTVSTVCPPVCLPRLVFQGYIHTGTILLLQPVLVPVVILELKEPEERSPKRDLVLSHVGYHGVGE